MLGRASLRVSRLVGPPIVVVGALDSAVALGRDDGLAARSFDVCDQFAAVVTFVGKHGFSPAIAKQIQRFGVIAALTG